MMVEHKMYIGDKPLLRMITLRVPEGRSEDMILLAADILGLQVWKRSEDAHPWYRFSPKRDPESEDE